MLCIQSLKLKNPVIQAPMAGCTDLAYRLLCRAYGMELAFLEMVASEGLVRSNKNTYAILKKTPADHPLGAQIVGGRPAAMAEAAHILEDLGFDVIDINFGCPAPKIAGKSAGASLLNKPKEAALILEAVMRTIKKTPVTVKLRLGVRDASGSEAVRIARIAADCGLSAVFVHGRTKVQGYTGTANYESIGRVKDAVRIPVIGNGDIFTGDDAIRMKNAAGVDGVMLGRGSLGNPWIFEEVARALDGGAPIAKPTLDDKKKALLKHFQLELAHRDEKTALLHMRRIACWYFKNMPRASVFRTAINRCADITPMRKLIEDFS
jgi:nifR3 family TIM-barrel protein